MDSVIPRYYMRGGRAVPETPRRVGELAPGIVETILAVPATTAIIIDQINMAASGTNGAIALMPRHNPGGLLMSRRAAIHTGLAFASTVTLQNIATHVFGEMEIAIWDTTNGRYGARLRSPLYWPYGGEVRVTATGTATINLAAVVSYREV